MNKFFLRSAILGKLLPSDAAFEVYFERIIKMLGG